MADFDNTNRGVLFPNDRKETDTHPDFTGSLNVDGVEYFLDGWRNTSKKDGRKFMAVKVKRKEKQPVKSSDAEPAQSGYDPDDDIGF